MAERPMAMLSMRVHEDTLAHFKAWAASQPPDAKGKRPEWTAEARRIMSLGFMCDLGRCNHGVKAARKVAHLGAYIEKFGYMPPPAGAERPRGESGPTAVVADFVPSPEDVETQSVDNGRAHDDDPLA